MNGDIVGNGSVPGTQAGTWLEFVRDLADANGVEHRLTDDEVDFLLWERTAWPLGGFEHVRDQLIGEFRQMKEKEQVSEDELKVLDPVDELPVDTSIRARQSKWDAVVELVVELHDKEPGRWLPVQRPKNFASAQAKWLRRRNPGVLVELRPERIFLRWDPEKAAELAAQEEKDE